MSVDLSGGLDDDLELVFPGQPDDPEMRESVNAWIWDDTGSFGVPRIGIEAVADQWETHDVNVNMAFADGRVFTLFAPGAVHDPLGAEGRPTILGAGALACEVIEPFGLLRLRLDGEVFANNVEGQLGGAFPGQGDPVHVELDVDLRPAAPPWLNGSLLEDAGRVMDTQEEGDLMGHPWRFEQLCRAEGILRVGDEEHRIDGGGNRIRRQSIRRLAKFWGHAWQAALFPSGRGFGYITYPPREDGKATYNEGYVFEGDGELIPARVIDPPWLQSLTPTGETVTCTLEPVRGDTVTIRGTTTASTYMVMPPDVGGGMRLQQTLVRYQWDGEAGTGMLERSMPGLT